MQRIQPPQTTIGMTAVAWALLTLAVAFAVTDWIGVARSDSRLRWIGKPGALLLLIGAALSLSPFSTSQREIFVAALLLAFVGDVFLLLEGERWFLAGLAAFLGAHLAYIDGFLVGGLHPERPLVYAGVAVAAVSLLAGGRIVSAVVRRRRHGLALAVILYTAAITAMVGLAAASGNPLALGGALLFYLSDALIAWNRFVRPLGWAKLPIIVTYHLAQAALVLSLALR